MLKNNISSMTQCGREITIKEIEEIKEIVNLFPHISRTELMETIAENLQWYSASGTNKIDATDTLLEKLESQGILNLPEKKTRSAYNPKKVDSASERTDPREIISCNLKDLSPITLEVVTDNDVALLWKEYIARYHYLGYYKPFGHIMRYFIQSERGRLGCILFSGASKSIGAREKWIGWTENQRLRNIAWIINNTRFLIFPWVQVKNLASHVLGQVHRQISGHWKERWGFSPVLMETFVDPERYQGTCYKASNWEYLGMTTGRGLARKGKQYTSSPKMIFMKPLVKHSGKLLCSEKLVGRII